MSLLEQEAEALNQVQRFMWSLGNGTLKIDTITELRAEARRLMKHYPISPGDRWLEAHGVSVDHDNRGVSGFHDGPPIWMGGS